MNTTFLTKCFCNLLLCDDNVCNNVIAGYLVPHTDHIMLSIIISANNSTLH